MDIIREELISIDEVPFLSAPGITVSALRLDKIHPVISGNKWYKLKGYLQEARLLHKKTVVTFGGAYSNHIIATAAASRAGGLKSIGLIRGEASPDLSHTLLQAQALGMELVFLSRQDYAAKKIPAQYITDDHYIIPEGGYGPAGATGAATIPIPGGFDMICCAVGTGTMMAGLLQQPQHVTGFSVLKNYTAHEHEIQELLQNPSIPVHINNDYSFGGYAKHSPELLRFMNELYQSDGIPTDFVYTGKLFYGVQQLIKNGYFHTTARILLIHSGGLQGNHSLPKGTLIF